MASTTTASIEKRCYYEVLNLPQTCTQEEIRSSYKKLALQRHPDKLIQSGISETDATASFQELRHAYEVLSDPKERSWYDSHRSQILFASPFDSDGVGGGGGGGIGMPDLFSFFSGSCYSGFDGEQGFYKVYGDVFGRVYMNEVNYCRKLGLWLGIVKEAPLFGDLGSDYGQVSAFYGYWLGFGTVMDFGWVSKWDTNAGVNRKSRRVMEEENKKVRKKAKKEYNDSVRELAEFVKKRDKRVIDMVKKKEIERERKREEEMKKRKELEQAKMERARNYVEPDWAKVDEDLINGIGEEEDEEEEDGEEEKKRELYCAACGKKFKSDKQWKNHEQSRKHKDKVAELRRFFKEEDVEFVDDGDEGGSKVDDVDEDKDDGFVSAEDDEEDELQEKFKECVGIDEGVENVVEEEEVNGKKDDGVEKVEEEVNGVVGKKVTFEEELNSVQREEVEVEVEAEEECNNKKGKKKSRRAKKEKGKANDDNSKDVASSNGGSDGDDDEFENRRGKGGKKGGDRKSKRDVESIPKNSSKGRKHREKDPNPVCEKCGEEFDSRNQLYKHLTETGHASLKSK